MPIVIDSCRKKPASLAQAWPDSLILDVTSRGEQPWVRFSPFYPHGGIPIPNSPDSFAMSVEGLWQGLKVFEQQDIDPGKWRITNMRGIKRSARSRGQILGHRFGIGSPIVLDYRRARYKIYLPAYRWVLEHKLTAETSELRAKASSMRIVLLDFETNGDVENLAKPLSHASLAKHFVEGTWPEMPATR